MNPKVRHNCIEVLVNDDELSGLNTVCKALGVAKSALVRSLINKQVQQHGMPPARQKESRGCRGPGRPANRASAGMRRLI
jgi:hypothetical protein